MGHSPTQTELIDRILSSRRRVVLLCGPAHCGKTTAAIELYERHLTDPTRPGCLLLAPNRLTVRWLRRQLLARRRSGVLAAPRVMGMATLAGEVLSAAGVPHQAISPVRRRLALQAIIAKLHSSGKLGPVARLADTPGLTAAVDRAIAELKRAAVEPCQLAEAVGPSRGKHRDLIAIYQAYQDYLHEAKLYDQEGRMWQAREALARMTGPVWPGLAAVVADGFTDFTPTQLAILKLLAGQVERLVITLPYADQPDRTKLWHWTKRQLRRIEHTFGNDCERIDAAADGQGPFDALMNGLFALDPAPATWPGELTTVAAAGADSECRAIARWAKRHLAAGVPPEAMAVTARNVDDYRPVLARVFTEAGLPPPAVTKPVRQTPLGRLLTALVRMADGYGAADVLAVTGSSYFRPQALGPFDPILPAVAEWIVREGNVLEGRRSYARAAERLAGQAKRPEEPDAEYASGLTRHLHRLGREAIERAGEMLEALFDLVAPLSAGGTLAELAGACRRTLLTLQLTDPPETADASSAAADLRAAAALDAVLAELEGLEGLPAEGRRLTASQFADTLTATLAETPCPPARSTGAIMLAGALDLRALRVGHLWLAGMNAKSFPAAAGEQALIGEADRRAWAGAGLPLDMRDDLIAREMLLFYLTVGRAETSLTVSWQFSDSGGRALERSAFVDALCRPAGGMDGRVTVLPPAEFAPPAERVVSERELLNSALAEAAAAPDNARAAGWAPALTVARRHHGPWLSRLAPALWASHRRWCRGRCDAYDGVVAQPRLLEELGSIVPAEVTFSVSQINTYLSCPWRYFAERWLKLAELAEPEEALLPRARGLLVHAVLRRTLETLGESGPVELSALASPEAAAALAQAIEAEAAAAAAAGVACPALWQRELHRLGQATGAYLRRQAASPVPAAEVTYLEFAFGMPPSSASDPASSVAPLVLDGPAGAVRIRGKIDRADTLFGPDGSRKMLVIDYKTGRLPDPKSDVQLPVYIKAIEQATGLPAAGGAFHGVRERDAKDRYLADFKLSRGKLAPNDTYGEELHAGISRVHQAVAAIAAGRFDVFGEHGCAGSYCPFRRICGYSDSRAVVKAPAEAEEGGDG